MNIKALLIVLCFAALTASTSHAVGIHAHVTLESQGKESTAGRILFRHVLGGLHIEAFVTHLRKKNCQLIIFNGNCSEEMVTSEELTVLGDLHLEDNNTSFYERIDPKLLARQLIGQHIAVVHKKRILACGIVEAPPSAD